MLRSLGIRNANIPRNFCDMVSSKISNTTATTATVEVKSFDAIPGPKGIFGIGTLYQYWPTIGTMCTVVISIEWFSHVYIAKDQIMI